jgi:hypothetical protein
MRTKELLRSIVGAALMIFLAGCGGDAKKLQAENEALRVEVEALRSRATTAEANAVREAEVKQLQADARDAVRLRGEITQLRTASKDAEKLRAENQQLRTENQKLRGAAQAAASAPAPTPTAQPVTFPRESWTFAGYTSPEAALVSAMWSMQQGNPKQYYESLTAEEQLRIAKTWEGKSEAEVVAKHQADIAQISGLRVLSQQSVSDSEIQMNVFIEGVNRPEKVSMKRVGNDWKFGGFLREPKPQ